MGIGSESITIILNRTQILDDHLNDQKEIAKKNVVDLFSEIETEELIEEPKANHISIRNFSIFTNGNYSGKEFELPTEADTTGITVPIKHHC